MHEESADNVESVVRSWNVLTYLAENANPTLTEIARNIEAPKSSTLRILNTLINLGLVSQDPDKKTYSIDYRVLNLSYHVLRRSVLRKQANPYLYELADASRLIACLGVVSGPVAITIDKVSLHSPLSVHQDEIGATVPVHVSSVGKVLLAYQPEGFVNEFLQEYPLTKFTDKTICDREAYLKELQRVRERGYAINEWEWRHDTVSIAMPVRNYAGEVIAAVALSRETAVHGDDGNRDEPFSQDHLDALKRAAERISFSCGYHSAEMLIDSAVWRGRSDGETRR